MAYITERATSFTTIGGINNYGKSVKVSGWFVVDPNGRRCRAFTGIDAESKAAEWAKFCTEKFGTRKAS